VIFEPIYQQTSENHGHSNNSN